MSHTTFEQTQWHFYDSRLLYIHHKYENICSDHLIFFLWHTLYQSVTMEIKYASTFLTLAPHALIEKCSHNICENIYHQNVLLTSELFSWQHWRTSIWIQAKSGVSWSCWYLQLKKLASNPSTFATTTSHVSTYTAQRIWNTFVMARINAVAEWIPAEIYVKYVTEFSIKIYHGWSKRLS